MAGRTNRNPLFSRSHWPKVLFRLRFEEKEEPLLSGFIDTSATVEPCRTSHLVRQSTYNFCFDNLPESTLIVCATAAWVRRALPMQPYSQHPTLPPIFLESSLW